jgi:uncharacterized protein
LAARAFDTRHFSEDQLGVDASSWLYQIENALAQYIPHAEIAGQEASKSSSAHLPVCRDTKDQMFLELADDARVDALVTGDADLLELDDPFGRHLRLRIITPQALLDQIK